MWVKPVGGALIGPRLSSPFGSSVRSQKGAPLDAGRATYSINGKLAVDSQVWKKVRPGQKKGVDGAEGFGQGPLPFDGAANTATTTRDL